MRLKKVTLKNFKRFDNFTIDLGETPQKIIVLVGPNGFGKSSVFDAFEEKLKDYKGAQRNPLPSFLSKLWFLAEKALRQESYNRAESVQIINDQQYNVFSKKSFYIRTSYRYTPQIAINSIRQLPEALDDIARPGSSVDLDQRLTENYERLVGKFYEVAWDSERPGKEIKKELIGKINSVLINILDIQISSLGNVQMGKGQLFFDKEDVKDFPYENLSSGEKEVVDIILDLIVKVDEFNDTVYCIDEPELHLNTSIQRKLLIEIDKLIPENCQLWVATHSIGFLRAVQEELREKSQVLDFSEKVYFKGEQTLVPIRQTRNNWKRIFQTALEDLTGLMSPQTIIYCEGKEEPDAQGGEAGLDAEIYNQIFDESRSEALFVSAGGGSSHVSNSDLALKVLSKAFDNVALYRLKDKDERTSAQREEFLAHSTQNRMLARREIENYIFDKEVMRSYCLMTSIRFDEKKYDSLIHNVNEQDMKTVQQQLCQLCHIATSVEAAKLILAKHITPALSIYKELESTIFYSKIVSDKVQ